MLHTPFHLGGVTREPWRDLPNGRAARTHWFALSDPHGASLAFSRLLEERPVDARLIVLGDIIDRGPGGLEILRRLDADKDALLLHGNHELLAWCALRAKAHGWVQREAFRIWTAHGGDLTLRQFREELASGREEPDPEHSEIPAIFGRIFRRMRPWHEDGDLFFVHGGVAPDHPEESLAAFSDPAGTPDGANASEATWDTPYHYAWYRQPKSPIRTPVVIQGKPRLLVHGHTPLPPDACITQQAINVDVGYGIKSAVEIKGRQFRRWFVKTDEIISNLDHPVS